MKTEDIDALTIGQVRAIAARASEALNQLRQVQNLLGTPPSALEPAAVGVPAAVPGVAQTNKGPMVLSDAERAQRDSLLAETRAKLDEMPERIQKAAKE